MGDRGVMIVEGCILKILTKSRIIFILSLWRRAIDDGRETIHATIGGRDEYFMDCQYEYVFACDTDHHGFISHHSGEWADPVDKKGVGRTEGRVRKAEGS